MPSEGQLVLPLLDTLREMGGGAAAGEAIDALSDRLGIPAQVRDQVQTYSWPKWGSRRRSPWRQRIHWCRHIAATRGLIDRSEKGYWRLTEQGSDSLVNCQPGVILVVYETPSGEAVWADAVTAAGALRDSSVQLLFTSPPYPLAGAGRRYGNLSEAETVELIMKCAPGWRRALTENGSLILNLRDCWLPRDVANGAAIRSLYIEKILLGLCEDAGMFLADRHIWRNPACAPTTPWVTVKKIRCGQDVEHVLWFSKTGVPYADTRAVMQPAKQSTIDAYRAKARTGQKAKVCPSGQKNIFEEAIAKAAAGEPVMVLPRTVQEFANSDPQVGLKRLIREHGLPTHPAQMPLELAKFWVRMVTKPGDHCYDPFGGWATLGLAAEELGRTWSISERSLGYVVGSSFRFDPSRVRFEPVGEAA